MNSGPRHSVSGGLLIQRPHGKQIRTLPTSLWQSESILNRVFAEQRGLLPLPKAAGPLRSALRTLRCPLPPRRATPVSAVYRPAGTSCVPGQLASERSRWLKRPPRIRRASLVSPHLPIWRAHSPGAAARQTPPPRPIADRTLSTGNTGTRSPLYQASALAGEGLRPTHGDAIPLLPQSEVLRVPSRAVPDQHGGAVAKVGHRLIGSNPTRKGQPKRPA